MGQKWIRLSAAGPDMEASRRQTREAGTVNARDRELWTARPEAEGVQGKQGGDGVGEEGPGMTRVTQRQTARLGAGTDQRRGAATLARSLEPDEAEATARGLARGRRIQAAECPARTWQWRFLAAETTEREREL